MITATITTGTATTAEAVKATVLLEGGAKIGESSGKLIDAADSGVVTLTRRAKRSPAM